MGDVLSSSFTLEWWLLDAAAAMAAAVEAAEAEESITAVLFSVGLCTLAQTKEFTIINSHNLFHMFLVGALAPTVPLDD